MTRLLVLWLLSLAAACCAAAPPEPAGADAAWRDWRRWQETLLRRVYSTPRAVVDDALGVLQAADPPAPLRARLTATAELATAVQVLSRTDQGMARHWLEAGVVAARDAGPAYRDALADLLALLAVDNIMQGRLATAERLLDEADVQVKSLIDPARAGPLDLGQGLLALARGDGAAAAMKFDRALATQPGNFQRARLLTWKAMAQRRFAHPFSGMMRSSLRLLEEARALTADGDYPVFRVDELVARVQTSVTLGDIKEGAADSTRIHLLAERLAPQGYNYADTAFTNVIVQFRREDLALAVKLQSQRLVLLWSIGIAGLVVCTAATVLLMHALQRRRLAGLSSELERRNAELQEMAQARARLLAAACHDLRQPAHALGLSAELAMLARATGNSAESVQATRQRLHSIWRNSITLTDMLGELMDQTRLAGGNYPVDLGPVSLRQLFDDVQLQFSELARRKGLALQVDECDLNVRSDRHLLRRVCFNLVSNAVKYTQQGRVHVNAEKQADGQVRLTVQDTGPGIPQEHLASIFQDYVRAAAGTGQEGLGIGLAIVKRAAEVLGHRLELRSEVGRGTTVTLTLRESRFGSDALPLNAATARPGSLQWVAVLEDDAESRRAVTALFHQWGYRVVEAASAQELGSRLQALGLQAPDLLVTDLHLGTLDGLEQASLIRAWPGCAQLPVVLITGDLDPSVAERAAALGITVGHKPIVPRRLLPLIQAALQPTGEAST